MKETFSEKAEAARQRTGMYASEPGDRFGAFVFKLDAKGPRFLALVSDGDSEECPWEHVSVSTQIRTPTWEEMCKIKDFFWGPEEWVVQYHPAAEAYVSNHRFCLHMWRPTIDELVTPPAWTVGFKELGEIDSHRKLEIARGMQHALQRQRGSNGQEQPWMD